MESKILITNKTDCSDAQALNYVLKAIDRPEEYALFYFEDGIRVQRIMRKDGYTLFYVYK